MITYEEYKDEIRKVFREVFSYLPEGKREAYIEGYIKDNERNDTLKTYFEYMMNEYGEERTLARIQSFAASAYMLYPEF